MQYNPTTHIQHSPKIYFFIAVHLLAIAGLFLFPPTWGRFALFIALYFLTGAFGITITYHRCLSHRAFTFRYRWIEWIFTTFGVMSFQQGPSWWVGLHRLHHRFSDTEQDPHQSLRGLLHSHFFWLFRMDPQWEAKNSQKVYQEAARDVASDPYYRFLDRFYYLPPLLAMGALYLIGGWAFVFWGGFIRLVAVWHVTWTVNSLTHRFGYKTFHIKGGDTSTNNWLVGLLAFGEGWHNNHHAFPSSARQGFFRWWEWDFSYLAIQTMKALGMVTQIKKVPKPLVQERRLPLATSVEAI